MPDAIELNQICKNFGELQAVKNLSFTVKEGDIYGFLGPNGSGKSTALRMMLGLMKPSSGDIQFFGQPLHTHRSNIMNRIGCIIEKPDFYGYLSALDNLKLIARSAGLDYSLVKFETLLEKVGLAKRGKDKVKTFSHGMKQRLGLAQVLIHNPDLIILDEPNTGLDPQGIIDLRNILCTLNQEEGKTILFSSHVLSEVQELCTEMIVINKGEKVVQGKVSELLSEEVLHVSFEVLQDNVNSFFESSIYNNLVEFSNNHSATIRLNKKSIAPVVKLLAEANYDIVKVDYKNPLEEYFLQITQSNA